MKTKLQQSGIAGIWCNFARVVNVQCGNLLMHSSTRFRRMIENRVAHQRGTAKANGLTSKAFLYRSKRCNLWALLERARLGSW